MSFISTIIALISGGATAITYANTYPDGATWWQVLLIAIVPGLVSNGVELFIFIAKKKGWLDKEDADSLIERKREKEDEQKEDTKEETKEEE